MLKLLAAAAAQGETVLRGAAREPEISDLAAFLNRCGGCVQGAGTSTIRVQGRRMLYSCSFSPMADRIVASTFACACAAAGGRVELTGCRPETYAPLLEILAQMGCRVETGPESAVITRLGSLHGAGRVFTGVYPALATDAAPLLAAAMLAADSASSTGNKIPGILPGMGSPVPGSNPVKFCSSRKDIPAAPRQRVRRDFLSHCFIAMILSKTAADP